MLRWLFSGLPVSLLGVYAALGILTFALGALFCIAHLIATGEFVIAPPSLILTGAPAYVATPALLLIGAAAVVTGWPLGNLFKEWLGKGLRGSMRAHRATTFGQGGSAAFSGLIEDWAQRYRPGSILLGQSLHELLWRVGWADDRGILTIAASRSGKGRAAIIPNLIVWPGSALVIDPKGTNAAVTAARRGKGGGRVTKFLGQEVHACLSP